MSTYKLLKKFIFEEVDRLVRRSAGLYMGSGIAGRQRGSIEIPPLNLGDQNDTDKQEEINDKEQEKSQFVPRVQKRNSG